MVTLVGFVLNGVEVEVADDGSSLLDALRDDLGIRSAKDGCSPQGQCGCCTVWIDGTARVACVTPIGRVRGRAVTTIEGLDDADQWADAFTDVGASQCGFCTPGIIMRLASIDPARRSDATAVGRALRAHLCRCTGWQTIREACAVVGSTAPRPDGRDLASAERRAALEGHAEQTVGPEVAVGSAGFADDTAPPDSLVAVLGTDGEWSVAETYSAARTAAGVVPGRRSTAPLTWPVALPDAPPDGWARTLQTTWVEPVALEPDATWCEPGGNPASVLGNGGAFGAKTDSEVGAVARQLADIHGVPVRVRLSREDVVRRGAKRPPMALGVRADGSGIVQLARPSDQASEDRLRSDLLAVAPRVVPSFVDVPGPPVSSSLRGAGWAEVAAVMSSLRDVPDHVVAPNGAEATAVIGPDGNLRVTVRCGAPLDAVVLRSYCIGATHMALGMVRSEGIAVDPEGVPIDLTIRSFGILRADEMPSIEVLIADDEGRPVNGSDAVFAAVLAAAWRAAGHPARIPAGP